MPTCTFFGHRDTPAAVKPKLKATLIDLIERHAVDTFYVGHQGAIDAMVYALLRELASSYPHIRYVVVLERIPSGASDLNAADTLLPEGLETVHPRYALIRRNEWMLDRSDYVITYIVHPWGGAARFAAMAKQRRKVVLSLA